MPFVKVAALSDLPPRSLMEARIADESYAVCNVEGEIYAVEGICPHAGGPLGQGALHGEIIVCPWHAWEFNCRTGSCEYDESLQLDKIPVKIENGDILIDVPYI